jgi:adenosylcobinamide kinase / adenosylcobinamide-phosphate guanylyltransferase
MAELILVVGGARSGKSAHALRLTESFERRVFIATAEAFDDEMRERVARHQAERGHGWRTIEAPLDPAGALTAVADPDAAVVIDCLTVWLGNLMYRDPGMADEGPVCAALLGAVRRSVAERVVVVANEVGMGIVPESELGRRFRDLAGRVNQRVASAADVVLLVVCGQTIVIKSPTGWSASE